jgi:hypothetical protein
MRERIEAFILAPRLHGLVRHIHGTARVELSEDDVVLTCVVRAGDFYYRPFAEHHNALGVKRLIFLVNGSPDSAVDQLGRFPGVTILATDAPYERYENAMRLYLMRRYSRTRWNLHLDIDELFDYPASSSLPLAQLISYLDSRGFTAMIGQMLDFSSDKPLNRLPTEVTTSLHGMFPFCDISGVRAEPWGADPSSGMAYHYGGLRAQIFGTSNCLTKFPLVKVSRSLRLITVHQLLNVRVADVTSLISHFPFNRFFREKAVEAVESGRYGVRTTPEYCAYHSVLVRRPDLRVLGPASERWSGVDELVDRGFLVASPAYRAWVQTNGATSPGMS